MKLFNKFLALTAAVVIAMAMSSCSSLFGTSKSVKATATSVAEQKAASKKSSPAKNSGKTATTSAKPAKAAPAHIDFSKISLTPSLEKMLREADSWIGTPYLYGGNDRKGIDCSGFVCQVFRNSVGLSLPRTSREQQKYCREVDREKIEPGDLVFFTIRGGSTVGHVGIYIGDNMFIHASSSKGVVISSLSTNYYVVNYYGSGRVDQFVAMTAAEKSKSSKSSKKSDSKPVAKPASKPASKPVAKPVAKPTPSVAPEPEQPLPTPQVVEEPQLAEVDEAAAEEANRNEVSRAIASRVSRIGKFSKDSGETTATD